MIQCMHFLSSVIVSSESDIRSDIYLELIYFCFILSPIYI